ncbi:MAG TPA: VOC family protein [Acidimicrobiales bacterium]|nr:VOC family protein [Acidimicrobiales bacterium]
MGTDDLAAFNHVGHCVTDIDRSRRFYEEALGFRYLYEFKAPDDSTASLLRVAPPVGLTATYLRLDGLILELLHFDRAGNPPRADRVMNEPGLTHLSVSVEDIPTALRKVTELGGEVLEDTRSDFAMMIRDPDGQLIEILPMDYRRRMAEQGF